MGDALDNLDPRNVSDLRMMAKAIREGWANTPERRKKLMDKLDEAVDKPDLPPRALTTIGKIYLEVDKFLYETAKQEAGQPDLHIQHSGNVTVTPDLSKLSDEELSNLRNVARKLDA